MLPSSSIPETNVIPMRRPRPPSFSAPSQTDLMLALGQMNRMGKVAPPAQPAQDQPPGAPPDVPASAIVRKSV